MSRNKMTNVEMVNDLMNFSPFGALSQVFIIEAVRYYSERVSKSIAEENSAAIISPLVWRDLAKDVHKRLEDNYGEGPKLILVQDNTIIRN